MLLRERERLVYDAYMRGNGAPAQDGLLVTPDLLHTPAANTIRAAMTAQAEAMMWRERSEVAPPARPEPPSTVRDMYEAVNEAYREMDSAMRELMCTPVGLNREAAEARGVAWLKSGCLSPEQLQDYDRIGRERGPGPVLAGEKTPSVAPFGGAETAAWILDAPNSACCGDLVPTFANG
jgi:hypothetical protein